jgi:hypothetical protein
MRTFRIQVFEEMKSGRRLIHSWGISVSETDKGPRDRHDAGVLSFFAKRLASFARKPGTFRGTFRPENELNH